MKESIYQYINRMVDKHPDLPYEFQDIAQAGARDTNHILWADGLKHIEQQRLTLKLLQIVGKAMDNPDTFSNIRGFLEERPIFLYMVSINSRIRLLLTEGLLDKEGLYYLGMRLATESEYEEEVKLGILLLGFYENDISRKIIRRLALHSVFTIYGIEASKNFKNQNRFLFDLLQNTEGYGKLAVLAVFEPILPQHKAYLYRKGAINGVAPNMSSIMCLEKVDMGDFYQDITLDELSFSECSYLLTYGGEHSDIKKFTHSLILVEKYMEVASIYAKSFIDLGAILVIEKNMKPYWHEHDLDIIKENNWSSNKEDEIQRKCNELLKKPLWDKVLYQELGNPIHTSSLIILVLERRKILPAFSSFIPLLQRDAFDMNILHYLLLDNYQEYLDIALEYLKMVLPEDVIYQDPLDIDEEDIDSSFRPDIWLVFLLKALRKERRNEEDLYIKCLSCRFPDARIEGINGLRVFKLEWSERVIPSLENALENEPVDKIRRRIQRLLGKGNKVEKEQRYIDISDISVEPTSWYTCMLETNIAGTFYRDMLVMEGRIEQGDILYLVREPDNKYDTNAILVTAEDGYILGYIPRVDNGVLACMMDDGKELYGILHSESLDDGKPYISVMLRRELDKEDKVIDLGKYHR